MKSSFESLLEKINLESISDYDISKLAEHVQREKENRMSKLDDNINHLTCELNRLYSLKGKHITSIQTESYDNDNHTCTVRTNADNKINKSTYRTIPKEIVMLYSDGKPCQFFNSTHEGLKYIKNKYPKFKTDDTSGINRAIRSNSFAFNYRWARSVETKDEINDDIYLYYVKSTGELVNNL